jgi:hypothetical protein
MKMRFAVLFILASVTATISVVRCQRPGGKASSPETPAAAAPTKGPHSSVEGSSTGGGSFGDESSLTILRWAAKDLSNEIRHSSPEIYKDLPNGWTQERLAEIIANVEPTVANQEVYKIPEVSRYGQRLMFNYGKRDDGSPFITATRLFVDAYSSYDVNSQPKQDFFYKIEEVKLKLAHEVAHLLGLGVSKETDMLEARAFSKSLMASLDSDNFECIPKEAPPIEVYGPLVMSQFSFDKSLAGDGRKKEFREKSTRTYVFNRPTGKAAVPSSSTTSCLEHNGMADQGIAQCPSSNSQDKNSSGNITVFAPQSYDEHFWVPSIRKSILEGIREYGFKEGYFSWKLVDLRKAVLTDEGYKSNYKYSREPDLNNQFADYMDYRVMQSSASKLTLESYPSLEQESWEFYRSQGKSQILIQFDNGKIVDSKLILLKSYNLWLEDKTPNDINLSVPLTCVRAFKPLEMPNRAKVN